MRENVMVKTMLKTNMPASPTRWSERRPAARSISGTVNTVIPTMMPPTPSVAYFAVSSVNPTFVNRFVE